MFTGAGATGRLLDLHDRGCRGSGPPPLPNGWEPIELAEETDARDDPHRDRGAAQAQRPRGAVGEVRPLRRHPLPPRAGAEPGSLPEMQRAPADPRPRAAAPVP